MCFIEELTQNFILKYRKIFHWRETVLSKKLFFCQIYAIVWGKMVQRDWQVFFFTSEMVEDFSLPEVITVSLFKCSSYIKCAARERDFV